MNSLATLLSTPSISALAEGLNEALEAAKVAPVFIGKKIELKRWISFYWSSRYILNNSLKDISDIFPEVEKEIGHDSTEFITTLNTWIISNHKNPLGILISETINSKNNTVNEIDDISDEGYFIFQIHVPCWLHYFQTPAELFRKSRQGNLNALEKLLRIDKSVVGDRFIARHIGKHAMNPMSEEYTALLTAMRGSPRKLGLKKVKSFLAAFLHALSRHMDKPMTYPEIQALFDQSAKERGLGEIDMDFPTPDAFEKAVRRNLRFWESLLPGQN